MGTDKRTKRQKIEALANTAEYNANEAANAAAMLESTGTPLERISASIKALWGKGLDVEFAVGEQLAQARAEFGGDDKNFGIWLKEQEFPFSGSTAYNLRIGFERKDEVLAFIATRQSLAGRDVGVNTAVSLMTKQPASLDTGEVEPVTDTTPADPAYAAIRQAYNVILVVEDGEPTGNRFESMHIDDLANSARFIKELAAAYQAARAERTRGN